MFALFTILTALSPAQAGTSATGVWSTGRDRAHREVFAACVDDYHGAGDLASACAGADWFVSYLYASGYTNTLVFSDDDAQAMDFQESGADDRYNDSGDFSLFSGKGSSGSFAFGAGWSGDLTVSGSETQWGEVDVEVVAIDASLTLDITGRVAFAAANINDGVHSILGFDTTTYDMTTTPAYYGYFLNHGYTVLDAWHYAADLGHIWTHAAAYVRFYSGACDTFGDTAASVSCNPTSGSSYTWSVWTL